MTSSIVSGLGSITGNVPTVTGAGSNRGATNGEWQLLIAKLNHARFTLGGRTKELSMCNRIDKWWNATEDFMPNRVGNPVTSKT